MINLSRVRKAKRRAEATLQADANRIAFGRTKAEKAATAAEQVKSERALDGAKREP
ncbi:DUF4169 family protein [Sphingomonas immobilis]|uniref:DUF4169 family protein n=1 Tax=Sphingomonas immobilis TaxID=3063997 RepID=UPI003D67C259